MSKNYSVKTVWTGPFWCQTIARFTISSSFYLSLGPHHCSLVCVCFFCQLNHNTYWMSPTNIAQRNFTKKFVYWDDVWCRARKINVNDERKSQKELKCFRLFRLDTSTITLFLICECDELLFLGCIMPNISIRWFSKMLSRTNNIYGAISLCFHDLSV